MADHLQPALILPETVRCLDALRRMQTERQQMVVVINEYGGTEGILTIEDLLEEVVGEIWDETDPDVQGAVHHPDGSITVDGSYPVHDLDDIGVDVPAGDYTTIAGFVLDQLGRVPESSEVITVDRWQMRVDDATDRQVRQIHISRTASAPHAPIDD